MLLFSISRLATGWTVRGSNPGVGEIFHTRPNGPWSPPSLLYNGYRVFPGGNSGSGVASLDECLTECGVRGYGALMK